MNMPPQEAEKHITAIAANLSKADGFFMLFHQADRVGRQQYASDQQVFEMLANFGAADPNNLRILMRAALAAHGATAEEVPA